MENKREWKYNFILYNMGTADKWEMYADLRKLPNVRMCKGGLPGNNRFLNKLHKLHWSSKINSKIKLPFKSLWFKSMTDGKFEDDRPVCFISFGGIYCNSEPKLIDYIKKLNPQNKVIAHYRDLITPQHRLDILKPKADLITSYDKEDAKKNDVIYAETHAYSRLAETTEPENFDHDLYFIGYAKDRLDYLYEIFDTLSTKGVRCNFKLAGVPKDKRRSDKGLHYLDTRLGYKEVVQDILKSRCVLEIVQANSTGVTMRTFEAITYKRKLLTNRHNADERKYFDNEQIREIHSIKDIDTEFLKSPIPYEKLSNVDAFSPTKELELFENLLNEKQIGR